MYENKIILFHLTKFKQESIILFPYFGLFSGTRGPIEDDMHLEYQAVPYLSSTSGTDTASEEVSDTKSRLPEGFQARVVSNLTGSGAGL